MATTTPNDWHELATRGSDGLEIALFWCRSTDDVKVTVADSRCDEDFEFGVAGADALAAFYHPFVFAAGGGICSGELRLSTDLQPQG